MMKKWLVVCSLFLLPSCFAHQTSSEARYRLLLQDQIVDNIKIGDKINVEPRTLEYEGEKKTVSGQIILPDGSSKVGKAFTVEMPGIYTVSYRAFFGTHEESVSLYYHCHRTSGDFFISSNKNNPALSGEYSHPITNGSIKGAVLNLDTSTTYTFDGEIDFSSYDFSNSFIDFVVDTSKQNSSDIESFTIRLTDTEDEGNYVDITVTDSGPIDDDGKGCYLLAGSNSQFKTGFEGGRNGRFHTSKYGTNIGMSFRDLPEKSAKVASLYFKYSEKELHASPLFGRQGAAAKDILTDLDDKEIYGSGIWNGFKNGKATLSIFANSLLNSSARLIVSKIANYDLSPLDFVDTDAPVIKIKYNGQSSISVPKASVNKPYRIFDAEVSDNYDRHLSYSTYVTYYDMSHGVDKDVSVINGTFTPKEEGKYTITYVAKDHSLNETTKTLDIVAINDPQEVHINLDKDTIDQELYSLVTIPSTEEVKDKITDGSGRSSVQREVYSPDNNLIEVEGNSFVPTQIGQYRVVYKATDYINNIATATLKVNISDPGHPVFVENFSLPPILINGHNYTLPEYSGAEVVDGVTRYLTASVSVNGEPLVNNSFTATGTSAVIKYTLKGVKGNIEHIENVQVIDVGYPIHLEKYFQGDFIEESNTNDVTLKASSSNAHDIFASILSYKNLYVKFAIDKDSFACDELEFKFTDSTNKNNSLSFHIKVKSNQTYLSIGSSKTDYEFSSFIEDDNETYAIDFNSSTRVLKDVLHKDVELVNYNDQGEPFIGFGGGVYLDITMKNIKSDSFVKMYSISNQPLGHLNYSEYYDFSDPIIVFHDNFITEQEYGADAFVPGVEIFDVLSNAEVTVSVKAPDGTYKIRNLDGRVDHSFVLDQFGSYLVTYRGEDSEGNIVSYPRKILVYDFIAPEITITGSLKATYGINASVTIPSYKVTDNLNDYTLDILLIMPNDEVRLLLIDRNGQVTSYLEKDNMYYNSSFKVNSKTFRAEQYGHYIMRFVAYDSDYNKTVKELSFDVK